MKIMGLGEVVIDWVAQIDHFPFPDEKIDSLSQNIFCGGVTANYMVAASRLGAKTEFVGVVGKDNYGDLIVEDFKKEGVGLKNLTLSDAMTPVNFIFVVRETGEKVIIQSPYMYTTVPDENIIQKEILSSVKLLHSSAIYPKLTKSLFKFAKEKGIVISLDLEKQIALRGKEKILPLLKFVDILLPNKEGALQLTGTTEIGAAAQKFLDWGIKKVVITLGEKGALVVTKEIHEIIPVFKVDNIIDTTGAGDTFCAAFGYFHVILNNPLIDSVKFANAAAALKIQKLGARTGMPTYSEVMNFLELNSTHREIP